MPVYRRPEYLRETLKSWSVARQVGRHRFLVVAEPGQPETVAAALEFVDVLNLTVIVNERRLGVLTNPWRAIEHGFQRGAGFVVYAEEDVLVADDVLTYMEWARRLDPEGVLVACATQRWFDPGDDDHAVVRSDRFAATVFGVWADRWEMVLRDSWDHDYSRRGWDWWISHDLIPDGGWSTLLPLHARSQHIGLEDGEHMTPEMFDDHLCPSFRDTFEPGDWRLVGERR